MKGITELPANIDPKDEKVWNYLVGRKTPVTIKQAVKALLISETHARRALEYFVFREIAQRNKIGGVTTYKAKE